MNQHLTHTLIATAVASLFATPILASDFVINQDIAAGHTQQGASTDTIKTNNNNPAQHYTNAGTIQGYGILEIGDWRTLTNAEGGVIDVNGICQASFPEISQKNRYQLSSSRDVVPDPRIFVYQSRSIDRPRNVLSCSHGTGRDPDDRYHSRSPRIRAGRSFLIHLLLFNRFRWLLRI